MWQPLVAENSVLEQAIVDATSSLWRDGVSLLAGVVDTSCLAACLKSLENERPELFLPGADPSRFYVSNGRFYTALKASGPFAAREILLAPAIEQVLTQCLGHDFVFESFGIINALPGAAEQHWHRDGGILFPGHPLEFMLPASAVTIAIPLVEMNDETGTTGFALGSHRTSGHVEEPDFEPLVPIGSAVIWDYRVFHKGMANKGSRARPLIYATCCRPWWSDVGNFDDGQAEKLAIARGAFDKLDQGLRERLLRARMLED